jgi:Na+/proline symporter
VSGLLVAALLITSLLLVHFTSRDRPMPAGRPLDVDDGLPLPEAGQASTVFSLTALFGAYFGIHLLLGVPALVGIACGSVAGLFTIRHWIQEHHSDTFESFLSSMFSGHSRNAAVFAISVSVVQCGYAASELLILREISRVFLGLRAEFATLFAVIIGIIGYFYVLFGGYLAVYRTDIVQIGLVAAMACCFGIYAAVTGSSGEVHASIWPRPGYWELPLVVPVAVADLSKYIYQFAIGAVMGFGLLATAPDAWKRVFVVATRRPNNFFRFTIFAFAGVAPFAVLVPISLSVPSIPDGPMNAAHFFARFTTNDYLFVAGSLGLVACFLSSFDSALLASIHVILIMRRKRKRIELEISRFHMLTGWMLIAIFFLFATLLSTGNPYLLANILLGPYALVAGIQAGTNARPTLLPENSVLWIVVAGFSLWFMYLVSTSGLPSTPTTFQVNTVPSAAAVFLIVALATKTMTKVRS